MTESPIQKQIIEFLRWKKCLVLRMNSGKVQDARSFAWIQLHDAGTPDLLVGIPKEGSHIMGWIETKRSSGGKLNPDQIRELRKYNSLGMPWLVADAMEDAERWITDFSYHGKEEYAQEVLDENRQFIFEKKQRRNAKLSTHELMRFNAWDDKRNLSTEDSSIPF